MHNIEAAEVLAKDIMGKIGNVLSATLIKAYDQGYQACWAEMEALRKAIEEKAKERDSQK